MSFLKRLTFSLWYYFNPPWDSGISPPELLDFINKHPAGRAIDIGCGTGTNMITLAEAGWEVTGVDFVPRAVRMTKRKISRARVQADLYVRDASDLKGIIGPFDLALDIGCFHGLGDKKADYLAELDRILAPGGHWLMYGFFASSPGTGLAEADLGLIPSSLTQIWRQDGTERSQRPSAWFLFQKTK